MIDRLRQSLQRIASFFRRAQLDQDFDSEMASHLELAIEENLRSGIRPAEARRQALIQFGGTQQAKENHRDSRGIPWLESLLQDLRFALRMLRKSPSFTAVAVLTLGLCIGANTAIFSVVDALIIRPLTYPDAGRLVTIHEIIPKLSSFAPLVPVNAVHFREWQKNARSFDQLVLLGGRSFTLTGTGDAQRIPGARVSSNVFSMLGVKPQLGRSFRADEDVPGHDQVVVISHPLWVSRFNANPDVIGKRIVLGGDSYEIIGVLPEDFHFPRLSQLYAMTVSEEHPEIWKPFALRDDELDAVGDFNFACIARLRPGVSISQAVSELNLLQADFVRQLGANVELHATLIPLQDQITGRSRASLELLLAAAAAVLLIGCVNIANLLLTQAVTRRNEMAIRSAIGADAARLTRQVFVESLLLSTLGGLCGIVVAYSAMRVILTNVPIDLPRMDEVHLNGWMLLFTLGVSTATGLLFATLPAWYIARIDPLATMRSSTRSATSATKVSRLRSLLVSLETALSVTCLIAGGLLLHSFINVLSVDTGFEARQLVTVDLNLPDTRYSDLTTKNTFLSALLERTRALPGVSASGISSKLPLSGEGGNNLVLAEGVDLPYEERPLADIRNVSPDYLTAIGIPLRKGRVFGESDRTRQVALVSALAAERIWPGQDVIGKRFRLGGIDSPLNEIVGVVGDVRAVSLNKSPSLTIYVPYWQRFRNDVSLIVKTVGDPAVVSSEIRGLIRESDPEIPVSAFQTMQGIVMSSVAPRRFQTTLVLLFAGAAALLAGLGIYGIVSYSTSQQTNEIGIRMALGAQRPTIARLVFGQALFPVGAGLLGGVVLSLGLRRVLSSFLFGINPADPATILGVICFLGLVAAAAIYFPLRRAIKISPMSALRYE